MHKILPREPTLTVFPYHAWFEYDGTIYYPAGVTYRGAKLPPIVKGEADRFEVPRQFFRYHRDRLQSLYETAFADIEIADDGYRLSGSGIRSPILFRAYPMKGLRLTRF